MVCILLPKTVLKKHMRCGNIQESKFYIVKCCPSVNYHGYPITALTVGKGGYMRPLTRYVSSVIIFTPLLLLVARSEPPANLPTFPWLAFSVSSWWMPNPYLWTALDASSLRLPPEPGPPLSPLKNPVLNFLELLPGREQGA